MQQRRVYVWWEYRMVNKETQPYTRSSLFLAIPFCLPFVFVFISVFHGISEEQERSTVWGKVKKLSKKFNNSREILNHYSLNCCGALPFSLEFFLKALCCKHCKYLCSAKYEIMPPGHFDENLYYIYIYILYIYMSTVERIILNITSLHTEPR